MMSNEDWLDKCLECQHCYVKQSDANEYHCRVSKSGVCKFKPAKLKKNHIQLGKSRREVIE